jgi:hypothetical protein
MKLNRKNLRKMILKEMSSMMSGPPIPTHTYTQMINAEMLLDNNANFMTACEAITKEGGKVLRYLRGGSGSAQLKALVDSCKAYLMQVPQVLEAYIKIDPLNRGADHHLEKEAYMRDRLVAIQKHLEASKLVAKKSMAVRHMLTKLNKAGHLYVLDNVFGSVFEPKDDGLL